MLNTPFPVWPSYTEEEAERIKEILLTNKVNYWTGEECRIFEEEYAGWVGAKYAVALSNGTVALEVALKSIGIEPGDEVIVTPRTFIASVSAIVLLGAIPVFADIDINSQNLTAETIQEKITANTKAIVCVHLAGWSCDMDEIMDLARQSNLYVVEDCAQAHGARYKKQSVGSIGHIAAWSFCQDKIMTTGGEGGMVTTNDQVLWSRVWSYKDHGKSWKAVYKTQHPPGFRWLHDNFGSNLRMLEMQAGIGRIQLKRMQAWHDARKKNMESIWETARQIDGLRVPVVPDYIDHAAYKCYVFVDPDYLLSGWNRDRIMTEIYKMGVPVYSGTCSEVYLERAFDNTGWRPEEPLPIAAELGETSLMFLVHPTLGEKEISITCKALQEVMKLAT